MATIGRNKAVIELPNFKFSGFFVRVVWLLVHIRALIRARNKVMVMLNWLCKDKKTAVGHIHQPIYLF